jgi:pyruvyl transferase EpsO
VKHGTELVPHAKVMTDLKESLSKVAEVINSDTIHYVDIPVHGNVGDILIMAGTIKFLEENGIRRTQTSGYFNYSPNWAEPGVPIVFHGGGNLGDLYACPQAIREEVVSKCHGNRIVVLPQTIHFSDTEKYEACCAIFSKHPDLHIFVRDAKSVTLARRMTPNVYLSPDMAHQLWPMAKPPRQGCGKLRFLRTDDERGSEHSSDEQKSIDWPELIGWHGTILRAYSKIGQLPLIRSFRLTANLHSAGWLRYSSYLIERSASYFSKHAEVDTDRLHGHILSSLLGIRNTVRDNSYGKNGNYVSCWTQTSNLVRSVKQIEHGDY